MIEKEPKGFVDYTVNIRSRVELFDQEEIRQASSISYFRDSCMQKMYTYDP